MRINNIYLLISILIFIVEALIALYLKTGFIRHTAGDFLVVVLIYCFVKSFFKANSIALAFSVFLFALGIELLQYINILSLLNLKHNRLAVLVLGNTFQVTDILAYALGLASFLIIEFKFLTHEYN